MGVQLFQVSYINLPYKYFYSFIYLQNRGTFCAGLTTRRCVQRVGERRALLFSERPERDRLLAEFLLFPLLRRIDDEGAEPPVVNRVEDEEEEVGGELETLRRRVAELP